LGLREFGGFRNQAVLGDFDRERLVRHGGSPVDSDVERTIYKTSILQNRRPQRLRQGIFKMLSLQNRETVKRGRGRPPVQSAAEARLALIEAAAAEFQANGYLETGMGAIARRAGLSTRTIYELVP